MHSKLIIILTLAEPNLPLTTIYIYQYINISSPCHSFLMVLLLICLCACMLTACDNTHNPSHANPLRPIITTSK